MPSKIDPEPYFFMWNSVVPLGSKDQPHLVNVPCYQHKTCLHLVAVSKFRVPPKVCPWCHSDTIKEMNDLENLGGINLPIV